VLGCCFSRSCLPGAAGWRVRGAGGSGVSGPPTEGGICREPGFQCGVGPFGRAGHAYGSPPVKEKWADRTRLWLRLARTDCARAQVSTLRQRFLKLGVQVIATVRRVVLLLPQTFPYRDSFHRLALSLGAQSG